MIFYRLTYFCRLNKTARIIFYNNVIEFKSDFIFKVSCCIKVSILNFRGKSFIILIVENNKNLLSNSPRWQPAVNVPQNTKRTKIEILILNLISFRIFWWFTFPSIFARMYILLQSSWNFFHCFSFQLFFFC